MTFSELYESTSLDFLNGVYCFSELHPKSANDILNFCKENKIQNHLGLNELHCTVIYDNMPHMNFTSCGIYPEPIECEVLGFELFNENNALVLKLNSKDLISRHNELVSKHNIQYEFKEYIPHITLSYDVGDIDISKLKFKNKSIFLIKEHLKEINSQKLKKIS